MSKHTPAPWTLGKGKVRVRTEKNNDGISELIAECYTTGNAILYPPLEEREANARLIASAPELLEALKALVACIDETRGMNAWNALEQANKAISKAEAKP